jgi:hypothetical protein
MYVRVVMLGFYAFHSVCLVLELTLEVLNTLAMFII